MLEITGATLLSVEEAKQLDENTLKAKDNWRLRSPGFYDYRAAFVYGVNGDVYDSGDGVDQSFGVRPALKINGLESSNLEIGDTITFGDHSFTIISDKYALCDDIIGEYPFRKDWRAKDANNYEASDIKKHIDDWFIQTKGRKEPISFDIPIYTDAISMFEYATGNNPGHYDVVDAVVSQILQGDPVIESIAEELNERFGDGAADHLDDIDLKDYITYTGTCEIDYEEMAAGDSDLLVYRVSCEFDVDKYAEKFELKELEEQEGDRDRSLKTEEKY